MQQPDAPHHPVAFFFHFSFKVTAILFYLFCEVINKNKFVINFVVCVVLLALDFWTVKNVTGRLLVGLRWWNETSEGGSVWRFESLPEGSRAINAYEKRWFWMMLVANPIAWGVLAFTALIKFEWGYLMVPIMGTIMGCSNLIGYFKCSKEAKNQLQSMGSSIMSSAVQSSFQAAIARV